MPKTLQILSIVTLLLCLEIPASAIEWDDSKFMALEDIEPGMMLIGMFTLFQRG